MGWRCGDEEDLGDLGGSTSSIGPRSLTGGAWHVLAPHDSTSCAQFRTSFDKYVSELALLSFAQEQI